MEGGQWRIKLGINMKDKNRDVCASDCSGLALDGGHRRPLQNRQHHQPGSAQAF